MNKEQKQLIASYKELLKQQNRLSFAYDRGYKVGRDFFELDEALKELKNKIAVDNPIYFIEEVEGRVITKNEKQLILEQLIKEKTAEVEELSNNKDIPEHTTLLRKKEKQLTKFSSLLDDLNNS